MTGVYVRNFRPYVPPPSPVVAPSVVPAPVHTKNKSSRPPKIHAVLAQCEELADGQRCDR